jgi:hypothetical protein
LTGSRNARSGHTLRELCADMDMARPSVSKHLAVLDSDRVRALSDLERALEDHPMDKPSFVYTTYIRTTPERLWRARTDPAFTERYWGVAFKTISQGWPQILSNFRTLLETGATISESQTSAAEARFIERETLNIRDRVSSGTSQARNAALSCPPSFHSLRRGDDCEQRSPGDAPGPTLRGDRRRVCRGPKQP